MSSETEEIVFKIDEEECPNYSNCPSCGRYRAEIESLRHELYISQKESQKHADINNVAMNMLTVLKMGLESGEVKSKE